MDEDERAAQCHCDDVLSTSIIGEAGDVDEPYEVEPDDDVPDIPDIEAPDLEAPDIEFGSIDFEDMEDW